MTVKISKPAIRKEKACDVSLDVSYADKLNKAVTQDGLIPVKLEEDVIIGRISHDLYSNPQSAVRELYANEIRACHESISQYNAKPRIEVHANAQTREFVIHGIDSKGIEQERFLEVLAVLGRSDNFDRSKPGQFGMGFASYTCLSDIIFVETFARNGDKYSVMGKGGMGFQILQKPKLTQYGTKLSMTATQKINITTLLATLKTCAYLSGIPTTVYFTDGTGITSEETLQQKTLPEFIQTSDKLVYDLNRHSKIRAYTFENENISACIGVSTRYSKYRYHLRLSDTFLASMSIQYTYDGIFKDRIGDITINVKREDKFRPTPDRERFTDESARKISDELDNLIIEKLSSVDIDNIYDFAREPDSILVSAFGTEIIHKIRTPAIEIAVLVQIERRCDKPGKNTQIILLDTPEKVLVAERLSRKKIAAAKQHDETITVMRATDRTDYENLVKYGITDLDAYLKNHKLAVDKTRNKKMIRLSKVSEPAKSELFERDTVPKNTIIAGEAYNQLRTYATQIENKDVEFPYITKAKTVKGTSIQQYTQESEKFLYHTNIGIMTVAQIRDDPRHVQIVKPEFVQMFNDTIIVVASSQYDYRLAVVIQGIGHYIQCTHMTIDTKMLLSKIQPYARDDTWIYGQDLQNISILSNLQNPWLLNCMVSMLKDNYYNSQSLAKSIRDIDGLITKKLAKAKEEK